jgi:tetratricopeptide (TPR) repeat protein
VKTARNDVCPCGSGKKFKRCCLAKSQSASPAAATVNAATSDKSSKNSITRAAPGTGLPDIYWDDDGLDDASNAVVDLIQARKLDEAERAALQLLEKYPGVPDGYDRLGMVFEARGNPKRAAEYYRAAVTFIEQHPSDYDDDALAYFLGRAKKLDPEPPGPLTERNL